MSILETSGLFPYLITYHITIIKILFFINDILKSIFIWIIIIIIYINESKRLNIEITRNNFITLNLLLVNSKIILRIDLFILLLFRLVIIILKNILLNLIFIIFQFSTWTFILCLVAEWIEQDNPLIIFRLII